MNCEAVIYKKRGNKDDIYRDLLQSTSRKDSNRPRDRVT
jgi:hypothetical protein